MNGAPTKVKCSLLKPLADLDEYRREWNKYLVHKTIRFEGVHMVSDEVERDREETPADDRSGVHMIRVAKAPRKITPAPMVSPHVLRLIQDAYRMGWEDRAQVEQDVRNGLIESPPDGAKIEPAVTEGSCPFCGTEVTSG